MPLEVWGSGASHLFVWLARITMDSSQRVHKPGGVPVRQEELEGVHGAHLGLAQLSAGARAMKHAVEITPSLTSTLCSCR